MTTEAQIAYLAGFFDGEGCVHFSARHDRNYAYPYYTINILVTQVTRHKEPLLMLKAAFGGTVLPARGRTANQKPQSVWRTGGENAYKALVQMLPYLTVKKPVAFLAILFWSWKQANGKIGSNITEAEHDVLATLRDVIFFYNGHPQGVALGLPEALAEGGQNGNRREAVH